MSLKSLHIFLVVVSVVACSVYGMWCVASFLRTGDSLLLLRALWPLGGGIALIFHGTAFYKQTEEEPWL